MKNITRYTSGAGDGMYESKEGYYVGYSEYKELQEENKLLLTFIKSFVSDFEGDYVMADGRIVDDPHFMLKVNYELAKEVIKKVECKIA